MEKLLSMKRLAMSQSNYIPWKGYFDMISRADEFVICDDVQYTKQDWRNRNILKTQNGLQWLTIPVKGSTHSKISEIEISDKKWNLKHWKTIRQAYCNSKYFGIYSPVIESVYQQAVQTKLSDINLHLIRAIKKILKISTPVKPYSDYPASEERNERIIRVCMAAGADVYLSGPAARDYINKNLFAKNGIEVEWMDYDRYPEYPQLFGDFEHKVSILDLIFNTGGNARKYMKY